MKNMVTVQISLDEFSTSPVWQTVIYFDADNYFTGLYCGW